MSWITTGLISIVFLTSYNLLSKLFSSKINPLYALPFVAIGVTISSLISLGIAKLGTTEGLIFTRSGAFLASVGGLLWGFGNIFFFLMFSKGAPLSVGIPFVVGALTSDIRCFIT